MTQTFQKPKKYGFMKQIRSVTDRVTDSVPWPNIHPNIVSGSEVVVAILFVIALLDPTPARAWIAFGLLLLGNILDAADGSIARKYGYDMNKGWIVDVVVDRVTEFISFLLFPWYLMLIWVLNLIYSIVGYIKGYHSMLALRIPFIFYFLYYYRDLLF